MAVNCTSNADAFGFPVGSAMQNTHETINKGLRIRHSWTIGVLFVCLAILVWPAPAQTIDHSGGFASHSDVTANGSTTFVGSVARLTSGFPQAGSLFSNGKVCIKNFVTTFPFVIAPLTTPPADGITFTMQSDSPTALGAAGGGLGYFILLNSVAVRFD